MENYIEMTHCSHCNEPSQAKCGYRSKNPITGVITECPRYFCHMCIHLRLHTIHVSPVLRMSAMCTCVDHYVELFGKPPPSHGIKLVKRDTNGAHYDGEVFIMPPPSDLKNHVKQTMCMAAGVRVGCSLTPNISDPTNENEASSVARPSAKTSNDLIPPPVPVPCTDIILKKEFVPFPPPEMVKLLQLACTDEYKLPEVMVNYTGTIRNGKGNITFLHNYFGMCLWHNLTGKCWVKHNQLNSHVNKWDCDRLIALCEKFMAVQPDLGRYLLGSLVHVDTCKLTSFCSTTRTKMKTHGTYDKTSTTKEGLYLKHYELLKAIEFKF